MWSDLPIIYYTYMYPPIGRMRVMNGLVLDRVSLPLLAKNIKRVQD